MCPLANAGCPEKEYRARSEERAVRQGLFSYVVLSWSRVSQVFLHLPAATAADATGLRAEPVIVTHDKLRLDLLNRIHGDAYYDEQ